MHIPVALVVAALTALSGDFDRVTAMITVASGAHAGTFLVRNVDSPCEITGQNAPRPKHQFEVSVGGVTAKVDPNTLTQLMLIIPNADAHGAVHSFFTSISFGSPGRGSAYITETRPGEKAAGGGTVTLVPHGQDATVMLDVTSADGVSYRGTIQCSGVSHT